MIKGSFLEDNLKISGWLPLTGYIFNFTHYASSWINGSEIFLFTRVNCALQSCYAVAGQAANSQLATSLTEVISRDADSF